MAVNHSPSLHRHGGTAGLLRPRLHVLGMEAAGVVESVGSAVTSYAPGDEVIVMRGARMGCHADYVTVNISSPNTKNLRELQGDQALAALGSGPGD